MSRFKNTNMQQVIKTERPLNVACPNCHQTKRFKAVNGHCDGIHTILMKCQNKKCNFEFVISDGEQVHKLT